MMILKLIALCNFQQSLGLAANLCIVRLPKHDSHSYLMYTNDNCTQEITDILKISHDLLSVGTKTSIS